MCSIIVQIVSEDRDLLKLCREILDEVGGTETGLSLHLEEGFSGGATLCLWDYVPGMTLPAASDAAHHLYLVHRNDVTRFREQTGVHDSHILLKPVTRATLAAFLGAAVAHAARPTRTDVQVDDRDEMLQYLIQANLRLQEYDQDRTTFLARAVHDFRAPLTALSGYCGLLLEEPLGPLTESQREVLRRMLNSAKRLSRMASAMFQLSVGRHVKRRPELQRSDLRECLDQALHEIAPSAAEKSLEINVDMAASPRPLYFEAAAIEQVLINILDNACKFTARGGLIELRGYPFFWDRRRSSPLLPQVAERRRRATGEPTGYRVDIRNSGGPIPDEHLSEIFEEYTCYGGGRDRSGGGLGLAITRLIVQQHDGQVWAENSDLGPMFSFVLPYGRPDSLHALEQIPKTA
jgi:signal transduction histidine kinase